MCSWCPLLVFKCVTVYFPDKPRNMQSFSLSQTFNQEILDFHWPAGSKKSLRKLVTEAVRQMLWKEKYNICLGDEV